MQAATRSPFHTASPGTPRPSTGKPSVSTYSGGTVSLRHRPAQRLDVGDVHPEPVALLVRDHDHRPGDRPADDLRVGALARLLGEQLGVGQAGHDARLARRQDRGAGDERPGTGAPAGLVDARDHLDAVPAQGALVAVEARVPADRRTPRQLAHRRRRYSASGTSARTLASSSVPNRSNGHRSRNTLPTIRSSSTNSRPGHAVGLALGAHVHGRVGGVGAVVAHHEDVPGGHRTRGPVAVAGHRAGAVDAGLVLDVVGLVERRRR